MSKDEQDTAIRFSCHDSEFSSDSSSKNGVPNGRQNTVKEVVGGSVIIKSNVAEERDGSL